MSEHRDDVGRCSNGLSARYYRAASAADRATYRKWIVAMATFYAALLLISGVVALVVDPGAGKTQVTKLAAPTITGSLRGDEKALAVDPASGLTELLDQR